MFVAWRDLRFAKGRFALMGIVVVLITVLVGLLSGLTAGLGWENTSGITGLAADHIVFSAPPDGEDVSFDDSSVSEPIWQGWAGVPGVERADPLGITITRITAAGTVAVAAFGVEPGSPLAPAPVSAGSVVLSSGAAIDLGVGPGGSVSTSAGSRTVSAVAGDAAFSHTPVIWVGLDDWQRLARPDRAGSRATIVALTTTGNPDFAAADRTLSTRTVERDDAVTAIASFAAENGSLQLMRGFLFVISALVIGAFFTVWTIQRSGDVAVLKALGASTSYLLRDALGQAVVLLALGTGVGTAIAVGVGAAIEQAVPFVLDVSTVLAPAAIMIAIGMGGAALAIRRITAVDPLTALGSAR